MNHICANVAEGYGDWLSCNETLMKMLDNLGIEGGGIGKIEGREEGRKKEGKDRESPAAFPGDPWGETQLSTPLNPPLSPSLSPPRFPRHTILWKQPLLQSNFNEDILLQLRPNALFATQIKSPHTHIALFLSTRGQETLAPSPSRWTAPHSGGNVYDTLEKRAGRGCLQSESNKHTDKSQQVNHLFERKQPKHTILNWVSSANTQTHAKMQYIGNYVYEKSFNCTSSKTANKVMTSFRGRNSAKGVKLIKDRVWDDGSNLIL